MKRAATQGNLFDREPSEEDRVKDFLKGLFHTIEQVWNFDLIEEAYEEYKIGREFEASMEDDIQEQEDDF